MSHLINIAAVQFKWKMEDYRSKVIFQNKISSIMEHIRTKVDDNHPLLVTFPEDIGTPMLIFDSYNAVKKTESFAAAVQNLILIYLPSVIRYKIKYGVSFIRALMLSQSPKMENMYTSIFSWASKKYNAYIVGGSITLADTIIRNNKKIPAGQNVYNVSYLFGPDGSIIGKQKKVYLIDIEGKSGFDLSNGKLEELKVFDTPFGKVGIAICLDAFKEDVCNKLFEDGAEILVQPSANSGQWSKQQQKDWLNGSHLAAYVRKNFKYAVNPMMNGKILDLAFEGQSSIISANDTGIKANYSSLEPTEGFINVAKHHDTQEILISTVEI